MLYSIFFFLMFFSYVWASFSHSFCTPQASYPCSYLLFFPSFLLIILFIRNKKGESIPESIQVCIVISIWLIYTLLGSVWIGLILLKLKTYCWSHCSKIIFKCVNSTVGPIFNEKVVKKWNLWVHEQYMMHCLLQKSQHLRLLFIKQYMNSNRVLPKRFKKKKKKKQIRKTQTWVQNVDPNIH